MPKFFVSKENVQDNVIQITGDNFKHMKNVLRLTIGDEIIINDRQGTDYTCIINAIDNQFMEATIKETQAASTEPHTQTVLFQSLIKGEKMEWVIQKAIEIGVSTIIPMSTKRCVVKIENAKKMKNKLDRWNKIAEGAAKQSGRGIVPEVLEPITYQEALNYAKDNLEGMCIPYEKEEVHSIKTYLQSDSKKSYGIFIGPEGGFSEEEIKAAQEMGCQSVTLGKRILRSETAGLVVLSSIMYETNEM